MYSNLEDIENLIPNQELINLTNDTTPAIEVNQERVNKAIEYAHEVINSYLRNKYKLPLKFTPILIRALSGDIAAYRLYSRRPRKCPEHIKEAYDEALKMLKDLQSGKSILDLPSEHPSEKEVQAPISMIVTNKTTGSKLFNDGMMSQFRGT